MTRAEPHSLKSCDGFVQRRLFIIFGSGIGSDSVCCFPTSLAAVIPAKAGIHTRDGPFLRVQSTTPADRWIPAFAGMTVKGQTD